MDRSNEEAIERPSLKTGEGGTKWWRLVRTKSAAQETNALRCLILKGKGPFLNIFLVVSMVHMQHWAL